MKRMTDEDGHQIVQCGKYAYAWRGHEPLAVGDNVLVPPNWLVPHATIHQVTGLGTDYEGDLSLIVRKVTETVVWQ